MIIKELDMFLPKNIRFCGKFHVTNNHCIVLNGKKGCLNGTNITGGPMTRLNVVYRRIYMPKEKLIILDDFLTLCKSTKDPKFYKLSGTFHA